MTICHIFFNKSTDFNQAGSARRQDRQPFSVHEAASWQENHGVPQLGWVGYPVTAILGEATGR
jgi:hypothetical protein